jgi:hypothetical protein
VGSAISLGRECADWLTGGFRRRVFFNRIPEFALTPVIRDKSLMR